MSTTNSADQILVHLVNSALDRAFTAAQMVQQDQKRMARNVVIDVELAVSDGDEIKLFNFDLGLMPSINLFLRDDGADDDGILGYVTVRVSETTATMVKRLEGLIAENFSQSRPREPIR